MSEHACWAEAREALREVLGVEGPARQIVLANVLAAAEERGRRAGIEERDALWAALGVLLDSVDYTGGACTVTEMVGAVLPLIVIQRAKAALALRDSRPVCNCGVRLGQHAAFCATIQPRDSGKEGTGHHVSIPLPLAQRILAALEDWAGHDGAAIAAELRAAVERKP